MENIFSTIFHIYRLIVFGEFWNAISIPVCRCVVGSFYDKWGWIFSAHRSFFFCICMERCVGADGRLRFISNHLYIAAPVGVDILAWSVECIDGGVRVDPFYREVQKLCGFGSRDLPVLHAGMEIRVLILRRMNLNMVGEKIPCKSQESGEQSL